MNQNRLLQSIRRRWYLALVGVVATAALCGVAFLAIEPTYQRSATELLMPGPLSIPEGGNPYLYLGGLTQASDVLVRAVSAAKVQDPIQAAHPGSSVTIARDVTTSGPMILVTVTGNSDADAAGALGRAVDEVSATMKSLQDEARIGASARISVVPLTVDTRSTMIQKTRFTAVGAIGAAGLVLTLLMVGLVDGLLLSLSQRRAATPHSVRERPHRDQLPLDDDAAPPTNATAVEVQLGALEVAASATSSRQGE
jgi:hypothetical protein